MSLPPRVLAYGLIPLLVLGGCASGSGMVPQPRTIVIFSGERIQADQAAMTEVDSWVRRQQEEITRNPDFLIRLHSTDDAGYPWRDFDIQGDTAIVYLQQLARDAETPFEIYAHLRLRAEREEVDEWLPEADHGKSGLDLEIAILDRVADVWLLGRSVYDTQAFGPLDELIYAREGGFLREFALVAQADRFAEERDAYFAENPGREDAFGSWLQRVFERSEPGYIRSPRVVENDEGDDPGSR